MTKFVKEGIQHDFGLFVYTKRKDGIIKSEIHRKIKYDLKQAYLAMKFRLNIESDYKQKILAYTNSDVDVTHEALHYLNSDEYNEFVQCQAIVAQSSDSKIRDNVNTLKSFSATKTELFDNEEDAIAWLNSFPSEPLETAKVHNYTRELDLKIESLDQIIS